ncbi:MAG: tryptophan--tRNA ligase [Candidatus Gracilibacteria bacterium]|jgi:tryptophanyl-tRNA synthetase|nr:tryptophan--tRNA ligase [Candidatus Gracilibacteria bacterium]
MKRIISGVKPTGKIHIGNYFGAMKQHVDMQNDFESFIFIADLHSLTSEKNPEALRTQSLEIAKNYLAFGLDPKKTLLFKQSDIPLVTELAWTLNCITPMGLLERGHAWKDAKENKKRDPNVGLFDYPVLMTADILLYSADLVPVGKDQKQHIEICRDLAKSFNNLYGETFKIPEEHIVKSVETVPGIDGQKMSKSYGNTIEIFSDEDILRKQIMSIVSDSKGIEEPKDPETCKIFAIYKLFLNENEEKSLRERYKKGNIGYGEIKKELFKKFMEYFADFRKKYQELSTKESYILDILEEGKKKALPIAEAKIIEIRKKVGIL